jgi:acyl-CoA synthetase (AMP-forming)/AMP-acid ligase II
MANKHWFLERIAQGGELPALISDEVTTSYRELQARVEEWGSHLAGCPVPPGATVTIDGDYSPTTAALLVALAINRNIVIPLSSVSAANKLRYQEIAQAQWIFRFGPDRRSFELHHASRGAEHPLYQRLRQDGAGGLVLFSSGTTGEPKAAVLNLEKLLGKYREQRRGRRTLVFLMFDHIGGINTLLHSLSQGGAVVSVSDRRPEVVLAAVERHRVELLPTTPTFLNMALLSGALESHDLGSLEMITYGTEPMPETTLRRLSQALPRVKLKQTYGLSELGILPTKSRSDTDAWVKLGGPGFEYRIVDDILWIKSDLAMLGYLNAPAPFDEEGWFNTQDLVEVDGDYLRIIGRKTELINVGGQKVYPSEVENVLLAIPNVADALVFGKRNPVTGMVVQARLVLTSPEDTEIVRRRVREHCREHLEAFKIPLHLEISSEPLHSQRFKKARVAP